MTTDTRTALLDVAEGAVRQKGFDGFSYADLAEAIGIRKASIHYHFPTKAALSEELIDRYRDRIMACCTTFAATHETGAGRLLALIGLYREALGSGTSLCLCVALTVSRESLSDAVRVKLGSFRGGVIDWLGTVFALGRADGSIAGTAAPEAEARAALALLEGAHLAARADGAVATFDAAVATLEARCRPG